MCLIAHAAAVCLVIDVWIAGFDGSRPHCDGWRAVRGAIQPGNSATASGRPRAVVNRG